MLRTQSTCEAGETFNTFNHTQVGQVTPARLSQILMLLNLAPDFQERILFIPPAEARLITERDLRAIAREANWTRHSGLGKAITYFLRHWKGSTIHVLILVPVLFVMMKTRALRQGNLRAGWTSYTYDGIRRTVSVVAPDRRP